MNARKLEYGHKGILFVDEYLDNLVDCCNSCGHNDNQFSNVYQHQQNYNTVPQNYVVVPVQVPQHFQPGLDFDSSKAGFSYDGSLSQSVRLFFSITSVFLFRFVFYMNSVFPFSLSFSFPRLFGSFIHWIILYQILILP